MTITIMADSYNEKEKGTNIIIITMVK
jgi:hypothetical protein